MRASADRMMPPLLWLPSVAMLSRAEFRSERKVGFETWPRSRDLLQGSLRHTSGCNAM